MNDSHFDDFADESTKERDKNHIFFPHNFSIVEKIFVGQIVGFEWFII